MLATWLYSSLLRRIGTLEKEALKLHDRVNSTEVLMVKQFVPIDRFERFEDSLSEKIDKMEDKFERKLDILLNRLG